MDRFSPRLAASLIADRHREAERSAGSRARTTTPRAKGTRDTPRRGAPGSARSRSLTRIVVLVATTAIAGAAFGGIALGASPGGGVTLCATEGGNVVWKGGGACKPNETSLQLATADALDALQDRVEALEADAAESQQLIVDLQEVVGMNGAALEEFQEVVGMNGAALDSLEELVGMNGATLDELAEVVGMNGATLDSLQELVGMNGAALDELIERVEELEQVVGMNG